MTRLKTVGMCVAAGILALVAITRIVPRGADFGIDHETAEHFYDVPSPLPDGKAGDIIRSERLLGAPLGSIAWRVLYRSTDEAGKPIAVSGMVVAPTGPAPAGGRPIVSWAHPTTGTAPQCAPSLSLDPFLGIAGLHELLDAGYVVAATDYSGMGADGPASYLIGATEGANVLDAARAARHIDAADAGTELVLWGHSQGGQAALFAGQRAASYAAELHLRGVAVAAPAAELGPLLDDHRDDISGVTIGSYAFAAYEEIYGQPSGTDLDTVLTPEAIARLPRMTPPCLLTHLSELHRIGEPLVGNFFAHDPTTTEPWAGWLAENTPGAEPIGAPILVTQGEKDQLVDPASTAQFVAGLRASGETVSFTRYPGIGHALAGERTVPRLMTWLGGLDGR